MGKLSKQALSLWAKKENREGQELWLPLVAHLVDTKNVISWLYSHWLNDSQRQLLQQDLTASEIEQLVKFVGYFHDIGKATPAFQTKPSYNRDYALDDELSVTGFTSLEEVPQITQPQAVLLTGLLIMADWIASSEFLGTDQSQPMFPLISLDQGFTDLDMEQRFEQAITTWDISGHWTPQIISNVDQQYDKRWHFNPRPVQHLMSEVIGQIADPGIIIVEAPMGIGKTEIALTAAEQLAFMTGASGLFMGLPTQATSNAMFSRVDKWVDKLAKEENVSLPIRLMHGKAQFNREMKSLPNAQNIDSPNSVVVNSWFSGKKSMLADFSIGTIDHLLLMSLKQKHLFLRHLGLSGKIVIIDEIHAYDTYMSSYLKRALQWLGTYHIPVIALSATLPKEKRTELVKAYYRNMVINWNKRIMLGEIAKLIRY